MAVDAGTQRAARTAVGKVVDAGWIELPGEIRDEIGAKPGDAVFARVIGPCTVIVTVLPHLSVDELVARYPIEGPIDERADRESWYNEAAKEVFGSRGKGG